MKNRILILLLVIATLGMLVALVSNERAYPRVFYHGRAAEDWAADFYPVFPPHATNEAMRAFHELGSNAVPTLRGLLKSRAPFYERVFLKNAGQIPSVARRELVDQIKPGKAVIRRLCAARALGVIGMDAGAAIPDLIVALDDPAGEVRSAATRALGCMGDPALLALAAATTNSNLTIRLAAVTALGEAGTNAAMVAPVLFDGILDPNESVSASALYALSRGGPQNLPVVLHEFAGSDPARRAAAGKAIQALNRPPHPLGRALIELTTNAVPEVRREALEALQVLRLEQPHIIAAYLRALNDRDPQVRWAAVQATGQAPGWITNAPLGEASVRILGLSGSLASNLVWKLNAMEADPDPSVGTAARQALNKLRLPETN